MPPRGSHMTYKREKKQERSQRPKNRSTQAKNGHRTRIAQATVLLTRRRTKSGCAQVVPPSEEAKFCSVVNGRSALEHCPGALVHPAVGRAVDGLGRQPHDLTPEDWKLYKQLEKVLPREHDSELTLQSTATEVLNAYLCEKLIGGGFLIGDTDGVIRGALDLYLSIVKFNLKQDAGDMQVARIYSDQISSCVQYKHALAYVTSLPCASIEIVGNEIRLGVWWMEERMAAARLGTAEVRWDQTTDQRCYTDALVSSWFRLVRDLRDDYRNLLRGVELDGWEPPEEAPEFKPAVPYPLTTRRVVAPAHSGQMTVLALWYQSPGVAISAARRFLTDIEVLKPYRFYRATHEGQGPVMVKFVDRFYRREAHEAWIAANVAVEATFESLPGGYMMITMPELSRSEGWSTYAELSEEEQVDSKQMLLEFITKAHEVTTVDGRTFVHGDCRRSNILAKTCPFSNRVTQLLLIDFDWTGVAGHSRYLVEPNEWLGPDRRRPQGVQLGAVLLAEHDFQTLRACFGSLWNE